VSPATVYRAYDAADGLLSVGITANLARRMRQHKRESAWYPHCADLVTTVCPSRELAAHAEDEAIAAERPLFNKAPSGSHDRRTCLHRERRRERERQRRLGAVGAVSAPPPDAAVARLGSRPAIQHPPPQGRMTLPAGAGRHSVMSAQT
jgi:predicted GIY-YIG superfamily endonuclease